MIHLNTSELEKIKKICETAGIDYFTLEQTNNSGIGSILTLTYETEVANHPASVSVEVTGVDNW